MKPSFQSRHSIGCCTPASYRPAMGTTAKQTHRNDDISTLIAYQFGRFLGSIAAELIIRRLRRTNWHSRLSAGRGAAR